MSNAFVATLIAPEPTPALAEVALPAVAAKLPHPQTRWLAANQAVDVHFSAPFTQDEEPARKALQSALMDMLAPFRVDVVLQADTLRRRKKLLLADMDSTIIGQECIDELARVVGRYDEISALTERAMRGALAFEPALRERVAMLQGIPVRVVEEVLQTRIVETPGAKTLVATMRAHGAWCALISGGFTLFVEAVATRLQFDECRANELEIAVQNNQPILAGRVKEPILGREAKLAALLDMRARHALHAQDTLCLGDGANDLAMIEAAGLGLAFHAKPKVAEVAHSALRFCDLTAVLYAQGYKSNEFAHSS